MRKILDAMTETMRDMWDTYANEAGWYHHDLFKIVRGSNISTIALPGDVIGALNDVMANPESTENIEYLAHLWTNTPAEQIKRVVDGMVPNDVADLPDFYKKLLLLMKIARVSGTVEFQALFDQFTIGDLIPSPMVFHERLYITESAVTPAALKFRKSCHYGRRSKKHSRTATIPLRIAYFCANNAPTNVGETFNLKKIIALLEMFRNSGHMTLDADVDLILEILEGETSAVGLDYIWTLNSDSDVALSGLFNPAQPKRDGFFSKLWKSMLSKKATPADIEIGAVFHELVDQKVIVGVKFETYQSWIRSLSTAGNEKYLPKVMHDVSRLIYLANVHRPDELLNMNEILDTVDIHYPGLIQKSDLNTWSLYSAWSKEPMPWWVYILAAMHVCTLNNFEVILTLDHMTDDIKRWVNIYPVEQGVSLCQNHSTTFEQDSVKQPTKLLIESDTGVLNSVHS